jgi:hypothetical protein
MVRSIFCHTRPVNRLVALLLFALAANIGLSGQAPIPKLDFKTAQVSEPALHFIGGNGTVGSVGGTGRIVDQPISVAIIERDLASCKEGHGLLDVQLSNIGNSSLTLPWSPDGTHVVVSQDGAGVEIRFDILNVAITSGKGAGAVATVALFGNPLIPGSQVTLPPGHSALLRNISIQSHQGDICGENLIATVTLFTDRAVKADGGHSLVSRERWSVQSQ